MGNPLLLSGVRAPSPKRTREVEGMPPSLVPRPLRVMGTREDARAARQLYNCVIV